MNVSSSATPTDRRFAHLNFDGRAGRRAINRRLAKDKRRLIVVNFENLPFKATFGI
jgi:hypothetical protein